MPKRPANYQELQAAAIKEIRLKKEELLERAENLERLAANFSSVTDWATNRLYLNVYDYDDDDGLHSLTEITSNWPFIATEPGEGYW